MDTITQMLAAQNYKPEEITMIVAVMNNPVAYQHAMTTGNFKAAYEMTLPVAEEKPEDLSIDLNTWFSSFAKEMPEDASALSASLTKFARYVQSVTDKSKTPS